MKKNETLKLRVVDKKGNIVKEVEAGTLDIRFGTISSLMELLDITDNMDSFDLLKKVSKAWRELTGLLSDVFPDMEPEDWELVRLNDLVPLVLQILKYTFSEIMTIPTDSKN